jgi:ribosomal protein L39E
MMASSRLFQTISTLYGIPVYKMTKISCKVQENFLRRYFVKHFLAVVLLAGHFPELVPKIA